MLDRKHAQNHSVVHDDLMVVEGNLTTHSFFPYAFILEHNPYVRGDLIVVLI